MGFDDYIDNYKRYKAGTQLVVRWLMDTAGTSAASTKPCAQRTKQGSTSDTVCIKTKDLPIMATHIMQQLSPSDVPKHIHTVLDQVISARKESALRHRSGGSKPSNIETNQADDSHRHFIDTLQRVREILHGCKIQRRKEVATALKNVRDDMSGDTPKTYNFEKLELHEPAHDFDGSSVSCSGGPELPSSETSTTTCSRVEYIFDDFEEGAEAAECFLLECHRIRRYVWSIWHHYRTQKASVIQAALITNAAIDVIHHLYQIFSVAFPEHAELEFLLDSNMWQADTPRPRTQGVPSDDEWEGSDSFEESLFVHDFGTMFPTKPVSEELHRIHQLYSRISPVYDSTLNSLDFTKTQLDDRTFPNVMIRLVPDLCLFNLASPCPPVDEISRRILDFCGLDLPPPSVPTLWACQIFVDLHMLLAQDLCLPFTDLQKLSKDVDLETKKRDILAKVLDADATTESTSRYLQRITSALTATAREDLIAELRTVPDHFAEAGTIVHNPKTARSTKHTPFYLFKHHPVLCGMLNFMLRGDIHILGLYTCTDWRSVISVLHLYNALRQTNILQNDWPDLEAVVDIYGCDQLFLGARPRGLCECLKRLKNVLDLIAGYSVSDGGCCATCGTRKRCSNLGQSFPDGGQLEPKLRLLTILRNRYITGNQDADSAFRDTFRALQSRIEDSPEFEHNRKMPSLNNKDGALDSIAFLKVLREGIKAEETELNFDFLALNRRCLNLLRRLRDRPSENFDGLLTSSVLFGKGTGDYIYLICLCIMMKAHKLSEQDSLVIKHGDHTQGKQSSASQGYLHVIGDIMLDVILREGSSEIVRARAGQ